MVVSPNNRRLTILWMALVVAIVPITCVCAEWNEHALTTIDLPLESNDCHTDNASEELADEHCPGCGDVSPAPTSQPETSSFALAIHAHDYVTIPLLLTRGPPAFGDTVNDKPVATPISEKVVLLN